MREAREIIEEKREKVNEKSCPRGEEKENLTVQEKLLTLARDELGTREAPAGSNRVKYNTAYYGREVSGPAYPWCCVFQWWLFRQAGAGRLFYGGGKTASCTELYRYYRNQGRAVGPAELQRGDLVFFVFDGGASGGMNHVGICERVENGYVTTIDGNTGTDSEANGGAVLRRRRALRFVGGAARVEEEARVDGEEEMKQYRYVAEMPEWAQTAAEKAIAAGVIKMDESGAAAVYETNLQSLVWLERLGLLDGPGKEPENGA